MEKIVSVIKALGPRQAGVRLDVPVADEERDVMRVYYSFLWLELKRVADEIDADMFDASILIDCCADVPRGSAGPPSPERARAILAIVENEAKAQLSCDEHARRLRVAGVHTAC